MLSKYILTDKLQDLYINDVNSALVESLLPLMDTIIQNAINGLRYWRSALIHADLKSAQISTLNIAEELIAHGFSEMMSLSLEKGLKQFIAPDRNCIDVAFLEEVEVSILSRCLLAQAKSATVRTV